MELETDENGIVTFLPAITWGVFIVQDTTVGLAFDYFASAADAAAQKTTRIQLHLDPGGAGELARGLASRASALLQRGGAR
jgi:hypothetical protein